MAVLNTVAEAISAFEQASTGAEVKSALIDLLDTLYHRGGETKLLGGHSSGYYVTEKTLQDYERILVDRFLTYTKEPESDDPKEMDDPKVNNSLKVLTNTDLTIYFKQKILEKLQQINGDWENKVKPKPLSDGDIGTNIQETLTLLDDIVWGTTSTEHNIATAIDNKLKDNPEPSGVEPTDSFLDLGDRLAEINYSEINVKPLTADKNQVYEAKKELGRYVEAFNPVNVKIKLKGQTKIANENGEVKPDPGFDGISSLKIEIPDDKLSGSGSGGSGGGGGAYGGGTGMTGPLNVGPTTITANGEYSAKSYGLSGFSEVKVDVSKFELPEGKEYTVKFVDRNSDVLYETTVAPGENATYEGPTPSYQDGYNDDFWVFAGWDPAPINVYSNMTCKAIYTNWYPNSANPAIQNYRYMSEEIQGAEGGYAEWEDMLKSTGSNPGGQYSQIGDIKLLKLNNGKLIRMMKVADHETGQATSTWLSIDSIPLGANRDNLDWEHSASRSYLNGEFLQNVIPSWLQSNIAHMTKYSLADYTGTTSDFPTGPDPKAIAKNDDSGTFPKVAPDQIPGLKFATTNDQIWIPSLHELYFLSENDFGEFSNKIYTVHGNVKIKNKDNKMWDSYKYAGGKPSYFGLIWDPLDSSGYQGAQYTESFTAFRITGNSQSYRDFITERNKGVVSKFYDSSGANNLTEIIRNYLPHVEGLVVTECAGIADREDMSKYWDKYDWDDHHATVDGFYYMNLEPPLNRYKILQTDRLSYLPHVFSTSTESYRTNGVTNMANIGGTATRDLFLYAASLTYNQNTKKWADPTSVYRRACLDGWGYLSDSAINESNAIFGFGLNAV